MLPLNRARPQTAAGLWHCCDKPSQWHPQQPGRQSQTLKLNCCAAPRSAMGIDFHLISNFAALALITLAGPAVIFILFYRRGAL